MVLREDKKEKISISLSSDVLKRVNEDVRREGRKRSTYIDFILRNHFGLTKASKPLARSAR